MANLQFGCDQNTRLYEKLEFVSDRLKDVSLSSVPVSSHHGGAADFEYPTRQIVDMMHPPQMVKSSSYYMQFAESYGWKFLGRNKAMPLAVANPTGSGRPHAELDPSTTKFTRAEWRVFTSTYFSAQDLRSRNWNLWFRIKRAEREFLLSFVVIFISFLLLSSGEGLARLKVIERICDSISVNE